MQLESAQELKVQAKQLFARQMIEPYRLDSRDLTDSVAPPDDQLENRLPRWLNSPAVGIHPVSENNYKLAIRLRDRTALALIEPVQKLAHDEVDVRIIGTVYKQDFHKQRRRPLHVGLSVAHICVTAGTLGCFVRKRGEPDLLLLSNNHVLANENRATVDDPIIQPGPRDGGNLTQDRVAVLREFIPLLQDKVNFLDAAVAKVEDVEVIMSLLYDNIGWNIGCLRGINTNPMGEQLTVKKIGRTTGITSGQITAFDIDDLPVTYSNNLKTRFNSQIEIMGVVNEPFSRPGDSGSIVFDEQCNAIGLLFAGSDSYSYVNPINTVFEALNIELALI